MNEAPPHRPRRALGATPEHVGHGLAGAREFVKSTDHLPDGEIYNMAVLFVGLAGVRAAMRKRQDINDACKAFADAMHELVGTPSRIPESKP